VSPTTIEVVYPPHRGAIGLRGNHAPLSWEHTTQPTRSEGEHHWFILHIPQGETLELKLVRGDEEWAQGRNYAVHAGDHLMLQPAFDRMKCELLPPQRIEHGGTAIAYQVLLPPSYGEQETKRYPVIYAQDGQALWSTSPDPFGVWRLDETLDSLLDLAVIQELIIVAIDTAEDRLGRLGPVPDPEHGGGQAQSHLAAIADGLKPVIDAQYRTLADREHTCVMGSSMGGVFSFYAAWTRPDVFGKAICLSSSFWWAGRHMIRSITRAPEPRPVIYLDSGAALDPREPAQDNFHHTRAMHRALDRVGYTPLELHRLTFPGQMHNAGAWAARVAIPLQLLFPAAATRESVIPTEHDADTLAFGAHDVRLSAARPRLRLQHNG
jgi:predicted alpha/beta superfamily hydrolase